MSKTIDDNEKYIIKKMYNFSCSPKMLARYYDVSLFEMADILGLPHNEKQIERLHRENCFYNHGYGPEEMLKRNMEWYGTYLEDGDFEKWQKYCFMSHWNPLFWIGKFQANRIPYTTKPSSMVRRNWILQRFEKFQEEQWTEFRNKILQFSNET